MIGNKSYHVLALFVQCTNPFVIILLHLNNIMHQKVQRVNQTPGPKYLGYLSSMIAPAALQLAALSVMIG